MKKLLCVSLALALMCGVAHAVALDGGAIASPETPQNVGASDNSSAKDIPEIQEGLKALQANDIKGALEKFEEARKSHPEFSPAELMLAKLALQLNAQSNGAAARTLIEQCILKNPTDPEAFLFLGDYNLGNGSVTEADLLFQRAGAMLQSFKGNEQRRTAMVRQYNGGMALVLERRGQFDQAVSYMQRFLTDDPQNAAAMQQLARIYLNMDKPDEAIKMLTQAKAINKDILTPQAIVALYYQQKNDKSMATKYMVDALNQAPKDLNTRLAAAQWAQQINSYEQAIQQVDSALRLDPTSEAAMLLRGNFALIKKDYSKAIEMYNKVLAKSPSNFAASNNIALALCEPFVTGKTAKTAAAQKDDLQRALEYATINAQRFQRQPETFSTLGYILFKNGNIDDSIRALQQSLQLSNGRMSPDTAYYLCAALNAKNAPEGVKQAKEIISKTLDAAPTFAMRPEAVALKAELDKK